VKARIFMLVYNAAPSIAPMTQEAVTRALDSTPEDVGLTVAFNGGKPFPIEDHPRLKTLCWGTRLGIAPAYNAAINATDEPFIGFLHNDCFVPRHGWIERLIEVAAEKGMAFPAVEHDQEELRARGMPTVPDAMPPSCCYVMTREAWNKVGGFDEKYQLCHFEDLDMFMRVREAGYTLARVGDVSVFHKRGVTRAMTVDESNTAFALNRALYASKWGIGGGLASGPTTVDVR
jgi:hypothetical protein